MATVPSTNGIDIEPIMALSESAGNTDLLAALADLFDVSKEALEEKSRRQEIVGIRMTIMYILREYAGMSFPSIGRLIGNRDHTTVIHAYNKMKKEVVENPSILGTLVGPITLAEAVKHRREKVAEELKEVNAKLYSQALASAHSSKLTRNMPRERVIPERNLRILEMYREGLTLENIGDMFNLTRERVRQVVISTIQAMAINESVSKGIIMDIDVVMEEEANKRRVAKEAKKPAKLVKEKKVRRWSRYYDVCRKCSSGIFPHERKGVCQRCLGAFSGAVREGIMADHGNKCDECDMTRSEAIGTHGRDLYVKKNQAVLCRKHFLQNSGLKMGSYRKYDWSRSHPFCTKCGTNKTPHSSRGLCMNCNGVLTKEQREDLIAGTGSKCGRCGKTRAVNLEDHKTDLRITRTRMILCVNCFLKYTRSQ